MVDEEILLDLGGATRQVDLAVEIHGIPAGSKEWLIAADILAGDVVLTPNQVNWYYSVALDRSFAYVPEDYRGGLVKVKSLVASESFNRIRLSIVRVTWAKNELAASYPRFIRCRYAAHRVSVSTQDATIESIHLLGEINR